MEKKTTTAGSNLIPSKCLRRLVTQAGDKLTPEEFSAFLSEVNISSDDNFDYGALISALCQ